MPRPVVLGNGTLLLAYDDRYLGRELFFPTIGIDNHLAGNLIKLGIWTPLGFSWLESDDWSRESRYEPGTLTAVSIFESTHLKLEVRESIHPSLPVIARRIFIDSKVAEPVEVRVFANQHLEIAESDIGNCVFWHPALQGLIHYKGPFYFLFGGRTATGGPAQYTAGHIKYGEALGTWKDAEDGLLDTNPMSQGSIDSTYALHTSLPAWGRSEAQTWLVCGTSLADVQSHFEILKGGVGAFLGECEDGWRAYLRPFDMRMGLAPFSPAAAPASSDAGASLSAPSGEGSFADAQDDKILTGSSGEDEVHLEDNAQRAAQDTSEEGTRSSRLTPRASHPDERLTPHAPRLEDSPLPEDILTFARQSLLILQTQIDRGGAILAANDSDIMMTNRANYSYLWPRDGALVAELLDRLGYHEPTAKMYRLLAKLVGPEQPYFLQKYRSDGTFGASWHPWTVYPPIQQDETALTLWSLAAHWDETRDVQLLRDVYPTLVAPCADFLVSYRDEEGLPKPSWDLWEERRAVHTFTCFTVVAGLRAAAQLAMAMGDDRTMGYAMAADEVLTAIRKHLVSPARGVLYRSMTDTGPDPQPDSSLLMCGLLGVIGPGDPVMDATADWIESTLMVDGGLARYPGDYYFRLVESVAGNAWHITTLWLAQYRLLQGRLDEGLSLMRWSMKRAASTGVLAEQAHPETRAPLSVSPLTWSHAEFLRAVVLASEIL